MSGIALAFPPCAICGADEWRESYRGDVRDGAWGRFRSNAVVKLCARCKVGRLDEPSCLSAAAYERAEYRKLLGQATDLAEQHRLHDPLQEHNLALVLRHGVRGKRVLDVGGGAGTFLGYVSGLAASVALVEPMSTFREAAREQGVASFRDTDEVAASGQCFDIVTCFQVIEHVDDPVALLRGAWNLVASGGTLVVTTPNRDDVLRELVPEFSRFFFRTVHRWYFEQESLGAAALAAGIVNSKRSTQHRRNLANAFGWMLDRKPVGAVELACLDAAADLWWRGYLEQRGRGDTLVLEASRSE